MKKLLTLSAFILGTIIVFSAPHKTYACIGNPPSSPSGVTASTIYRNAIYLTWSPSSVAEGTLDYYKIYYNTYPAGYKGNTLGNITSTTTSGLSASTTYTFRVTAHDTCSNESAPSFGVSATTLTSSQTNPGTPIFVPSAPVTNPITTAPMYTLLSSTSGAYMAVATSTLNIKTFPGGSNTQVQYNNNGAFGGDSGLTYTPSSATQLTLEANNVKQVWHDLGNQDTTYMFTSGAEVDWQIHDDNLPSTFSGININVGGEAEYFIIAPGALLSNIDHRFYINNVGLFAIKGDKSSNALYTLRAGTETDDNSGAIFQATGSANISGVATSSYFRASSLTATSSFMLASTTDLSIGRALYDSAKSKGANGQIFQSNGTSASWVATSTLGLQAALTAGTGLQFSGNTLNCKTATASVQGCLTGTDWNTFNNKVSSQWITSGSDIYYSAGKVGVMTVPQYSEFELYHGTPGTTFMPDSNAAMQLASGGNATNWWLSVPSSGATDANIIFRNDGNNAGPWQGLTWNASTHATGIGPDAGAGGGAFTHDLVVDGDGNVGIQSDGFPTAVLDVNGNTRLRSGLYDGTNSSGSNGNILKSTGSATAWVATSTLFNASSIDTILNATSTAVLKNQTASVASVNSYTPAASSTYMIVATTDITAEAVQTLTVGVTYTDAGGTSRTQNFFGMGLTTAALGSTGDSNFPPMTIRPMKNTSITVATTVTGVGSISYNIDVSILPVSTQ